MGLDDAWTRRVIAGTLARHRPTYEEKEHAKAYKLMKVKKETQPKHAFLKRKVRHKPHKSRVQRNLPKSSRRAAKSRSSSNSESRSNSSDHGMQSQSARGACNADACQLRHISPRFADYEMDTGRVGGILVAKRAGPHEWAEMQSYWHKETQDAIRKEKERLESGRRAFQARLGEQMLELQKQEAFEKREKLGERERVLRDQADWQSAQDAKQQRKARQFRENREFIMQQISAIQEEKRMKLQRAKIDEQKRALELKRAIEEEAQRSKARKLAQIEERRQLMLENQRTKALRAQETAKERAREDEQLRAHAEKMQKIEDERRAAAEERRLALLERETIAMARSKGIEERMREDELRAERDRLHSERVRDRQLRERDEKRKRLIEDIRLANTRLLEEKRTLERKERQQATELAERLQRERDHGLALERKNREEVHRRNLKYAEDLRNQIKSEHRRRRAHPEAMSSVERQLNAQLLKRVVR